YDEIRTSLLEYASAKGLSPCWVVDAAEIAKANGDLGTFEHFLPRLRSLMNDEARTEQHGFRISSGETCWSERQDAAKLLFGSNDWKELESKAVGQLTGTLPETKSRWFCVDVLCYGTKSGDIIPLAEG